MDGERPASEVAWLYIVSELELVAARWDAAVTEIAQEMNAMNSGAQPPVAQDVIATTSVTHPVVAQYVIAMTPTTQPAATQEIIQPSQREEAEAAAQDVAQPPTPSHTIQLSCSAQTVYTLFQSFVFDDTRPGFD